MSKPSRTVLVRWVNETLSLNYTKVDEFGTGAVYCQLIDSIYGDVPMSRVRFNSRQPFDYEQNYKILQQEFLRHGITRSFDRQKLMQCRLQDNLDFTQWFYAFWHESGHIADYDPIAQRGGGSKAATPQISSPRIPNGPPNIGTPKLPQDRTAFGKPPNASQIPAQRKPSPSSTSSAGWKLAPQNNGLGFRNEGGADTSHERIATSSVPSSPGGAISEGAVALDVQTIFSENEDLRQSVDILLAERDLYYEKLTVIEELVNTEMDALYMKWGDESSTDRESDPLLIMMRRLQGILYSRPDGFEPPNQLEDEPF